MSLPFFCPPFGGFVFVHVCAYLIFPYFLVLLYLLYFIYFFVLVIDLFICFFLNISLSFPPFFLPYGRILKCHSEINYCDLLHLLTTLPPDLKRLRGEGEALGFFCQWLRKCGSVPPLFHTLFVAWWLIGKACVVFVCSVIGCTAVDFVSVLIVT